MAGTAGARRPADGSVHVAASAPVAGAPPAGRRRGDRRTPADPLVVLVPDRAGDWRLDPARGGGALWDVGCYGVSTARFFAGAEPVDVRALPHVGPTGVDLTLAALLEFPGGVLASVDCSFEQPFRCAYELVGTRGRHRGPRRLSPAREGRPIARLRTIGLGADSGAAAGRRPDAGVRADRPVRGDG